MDYFCTPTASTSNLRLRTVQCIYNACCTRRGISNRAGGPRAPFGEISTERRREEKGAEWSRREGEGGSWNIGHRSGGVFEGGVTAVLSHARNDFHPQPRWWWWWWSSTYPMPRTSFICNTRGTIRSSPPWSEIRARFHARPPSLCDDTCLHRERPLLCARGRREHPPALTWQNRTVHYLAGEIGGESNLAPGRSWLIDAP